MNLAFFTNQSGLERFLISHKILLNAIKQSLFLCNTFHHVVFVSEGLGHEPHKGPKQVTGSYSPSSTPLPPAAGGNHLSSCQWPPDK